MKTGVLWNEVVTRIQAESYPDIALEHVLADNCAMQLVRWPKQYDVIVTDNLFGDILSDVAAMLTGSLGMLPSASLGAADPKTKRRKALYEPVHGSAPDIAGKGLANPIAMIASFGMCLRYSFGLGEWADKVDTAIANVLAKGIRTKDIAAKDEKTVTTKEMGAAILEELKALADQLFRFRRRQRPQPQRIQADEARRILLVIGAAVILEGHQRILVKRLRRLAAHRRSHCPCRA